MFNLTLQSRSGLGVRSRLAATTAAAITIAITAAIAMFSTPALASDRECASPDWLRESSIEVPEDKAPGMRIVDLGGSGGMRTFFIAFAGGDDLASGLRKFARLHQVQSGFISGAGAFRCGVTGWYDPARKQLRTTQLGAVEITSMSGNFGIVDGNPISHIHVSGADIHGKVGGGHLVRGIVGPGLEVMVTAMPGTLRRKLDDDAGAFVPDLP